MRRLPCAFARSCAPTHTVAAALLGPGRRGRVGTTQPLPPNASWPRTAAGWRRREVHGALAALAAEPGSAAQASAGAERNIVVAVDGSQDSQWACEWVLEQLLRPGDVLHVASCIPYYPAMVGLYTTPDGRMAALDIERVLAEEDRHLAAAEQRLEDWCGAQLGGRGVRYVTELLREDPATVGDRSMIGKAICEKAAALDAAAVVIASHAKSALSEFVLGSVADFCSHHCPTPVLVLHAPLQPRLPSERPQAGSRAGGQPAAQEAHTQAAAPTTGQRAGKQPAAAVAGSMDWNNEDVIFIEEDDEREQNIFNVEGFDGLVSSADFPSEESNLLGLTADAPGIGSQAAAALAEEEEEEEEGGPGTSRGPGTQQQQGVEAAGSRQQQGQGPQGRRILLAVDDSDASDMACSWTLNHIVRPGDRIVLVHIIPTLPVRAMWGGPLDGTVFFMPPLPVQEFKAAAEHYMGHRFEPVLQEAGVPYEKEILLEATEPSVQGIGAAICDRAAAEGAALVVLGSQTRAGLEEFMLGSIATFVSHHCTAPVAVLH